MASLFDFVFGCWHKNYSFPMTASTKNGARRRPIAAQETGTYVVCLDCGREFPYDWKAMKVLEPAKEPKQSGQLAPVKSFAATNGRTA